MDSEITKSQKRLTSFEKDGLSLFTAFKDMYDKIHDAAKRGDDLPSFWITKKGPQDQTLKALQDLDKMMKSCMKDPSKITPNILDTIHQQTKIIGDLARETNKQLDTHDDYSMREASDRGRKRYDFFTELGNMDARLFPDKQAKTKTEEMKKAEVPENKAGKKLERSNSMRAGKHKVSIDAMIKQDSPAPNAGRNTVHSQHSRTVRTSSKEINPLS